MANKAYIAVTTDELLERREGELEAERNRLGREIAALRRPLKRWSRASRRSRASLQLELALVLGQLAEVREIRRAFLGLAHNAHIRERALPNFVAENPTYATWVADEVLEAQEAAHPQPSN